MQPDKMRDEAHAVDDGMTPLDPAQVHVIRIRTVLVVIVALLAAGWAGYFLDRALAVPIMALPGAALLLGLTAILFYPARRYRGWGYREGEDEIEIKHGRLIRVRTIVPFGRVQHIDVAQGPVQRPFGLATLIMHTAGTHGASVPLPGLRQADAEALRERIRAKIRQDLV